MLGYFSAQQVNSVSRSRSDTRARAARARRAAAAKAARREHRLAELINIGLVTGNSVELGNLVKHTRPVKWTFELINKGFVFNWSSAIFAPGFVYTGVSPLFRIKCSEKTL